MQILILAGGSGSRLWPLSREEHAKQFLALLNEHSLLQNTVLRLKDYPINIISNERSEVLILEQLTKVLPNFKKENIILEPQARNTAPAIAYGCSFFDEDEIIAVFPSDHVILESDKFLKLLKKAEEHAKNGKIVTFGITPSRAETGYGYIQTNQSEEAVLDVISFKEKPDQATAENYLKAGNYYWNSGMFVFSVKTIFEEFQKYCPEIYEILCKLKDSQNIKDVYSLFPKISIDYAVMEKSKKITLLPASVGWNDIGGYEALWESLEKDKDNNAISGDLNGYFLESSDNLVISKSSNPCTVAAVGVSDIVLALTDDAVLIADKKNSQDVKQIYQKLKDSGEKEALIHSKVYRPWGFYKNIKEEKGFKIKEIAVKPKHRLSLQSHKYRSESWTVVKGEALVQIEDKMVSLKKGENILVPLNAKHRLTNLSKEEELIIVEVQMGSYLEEDDITRYEDDYKRS